MQKPRRIVASTSKSKKRDHRERNGAVVLSLRSARMKQPEDKDFSYEMVPLKIVSWPVGTWPLQDYNFKTGAKSVIALVLLLLTVLILQMEFCLSDGNPEKNLDTFVIGSCGLLAISKVACFRFRPSGLIANFVSAVKDYQDLRDDERRAIVKRHAHMGRMASANMLFFIYFSATVCCVAPMFVGRDDTMESYNETEEGELNYPMPSALTLELLHMPGYMYSWVFIGEYVLLLTIAAGNLGSDSLFFGIVFHLCGQVEVLKLDFSRFLDEGKNSARRFNELVRRHHHLLVLADHLNDTIGYVLLLQLLSSCLLICVTGFQLILSLQVHNTVVVIKSFIAMSTLLTQTFAYSYVGEYSKNQFGGVGYMAYCSDWHHAPCILSRNIIFVIMETRTPVQLKAGKFFVVNLETYMSILKTSMSYLSVLRLMVTE
ncbi:odorant receptor 10-like [Halictus rubicundus]|uniref:odorant receptor 10-like n=1 Tax=Halictus rubicundus TaxID=77578 RepID=UPI00403580AF